MDLHESVVRRSYVPMALWSVTGNPERFALGF